MGRATWTAHRRRSLISSTRTQHHIFKCTPFTYITHDCSLWRRIDSKKRSRAWHPKTLFSLPITLVPSTLYIQAHTICSAPLLVSVSRSIESDSRLQRHFPNPSKMEGPANQSIKRDEHRFLLRWWLDLLGHRKRIIWDRRECRHWCIHRLLLWLLLRRDGVLPLWRLWGISRLNRGWRGYSLRWC